MLSHLSGVRLRLVVSFLAIGLFFGGTVLFSAELLLRDASTAILQWQVRPILDLLIDTEERAWNIELKAEDHFVNRKTATQQLSLFYGSDLARVLDLHFYVGKQIPSAWLALPAGLNFIEDDVFIIIETRNEVNYALSGNVAEKKFIQAKMLQNLSLCLIVALILASLIAFFLAKRLSSPLVKLANYVKYKTSVSQDLPTNIVVENFNTNSLTISSKSTLDPSKASDSELIQICDNLVEARILADAIKDYENQLTDTLLREQRFAGDVSHELRTSLTIFLGSLEILEARLATLDPEGSLQVYIERMQRTLFKMISTVNALLILARPQETLILEKINLLKLLESYMQKHPQLKIHFTTSDLPKDFEILGQPELLAIVLDNLFENAKKYASTPAIELHLYPEYFEIRNQGSLSAELPIFEHGVRGEADSELPGFGIGLSIVKRVCERLNWQIHCLAENQQIIFKINFKQENLA